MMKLIEQLIGDGLQADQAAGELAQDEAKRQDRGKAYQQLEATFAQMCADGNLDGKEIAQLMAKFREAGLDTTTLQGIASQLKMGDSTSRVKVTNDLKTSIEEQLMFAETTNNDPNFAFKAQYVTAKSQHAWDLASRVSKADYEIAKAIIANFKA